MEAILRGRNAERLWHCYRKEWVALWKRCFSGEDPRQVRMADLRRRMQAIRPDVRLAVW